MKSGARIFKKSESILPNFSWILALGLLGFLAGFFGPIVLNPEANQGPLVGIFISGPAGAFLGLVMFVLSRILKWNSATQWRLFLLVAPTLVLATLFFVLPQPALRGYRLEIQVKNCQTLSEAREEILKSWDQRVSRVDWVKARDGWRAEMDQKLQRESGVVIEAVLLRYKEMRLHQKPWNHGQPFETEWQSANTVKTYFVAEPTCEKLPSGASGIYTVEATDQVANAQKDQAWPPSEMKGFLPYQTLQPTM